MLDRADLQHRHCWWDGDRVPECEWVTHFRRQARAHQCHWREERDIQMGYLKRGENRYPNGAKMAPYKDNQGKNFLSGVITAAVEHRLSYREPHETLQPDRLWFDLLSSMPMCFNLFGEIWNDGSRVSEAVSKLWGGGPGQPAQVKFEHSPGRRQTEYIGDKTAFDVALLVGEPTGPRTVIGIETKYHECAVAEPEPDVTRMPRYREVTEQSGIFSPDWEHHVKGTPLQQIWRDHLLLLSMLQHPSGSWSNGRYVLVHPAGNPAFAKLGKQYREQVLEDDSTFEVRTVEELLDAGVLHTSATAGLFRERYLFAECPGCDPRDPVVG